MIKQHHLWTDSVIWLLTFNYMLHLYRHILKITSQLHNMSGNFQHSLNCPPLHAVRVTAKWSKSFFQICRTYFHARSWWVPLKMLLYTFDMTQVQLTWVSTWSYRNKRYHTSSPDELWLICFISTSAEVIPLWVLLLTDLEKTQALWASFKRKSIRSFERFLSYWSWTP